MAHILRGEIYWADLNPIRAKNQAALRPVLILSNDHFNSRSGTVIALAITGRPQKAGFPLTFLLPEEVLAHSAWIKLSQIRTVSVERLGKRVGAIELDEMDRIVDGFLELVT